MERESFIFYRSFASIRSLRQKERDWMVWAIIDYALDGIEPKWEKAPNRAFLEILWNSYRPVIDANTRKYLAGKKGGAPIGSNNNPNGRRGNQELSNNEPITNQELTINLPNTKDNNKENTKDKENKLDANASSPQVESADVSQQDKGKIKSTNQVMELWNRMIDETGAPLRKVARFTDKRKKKVQVRWREFMELGDPTEVVLKIFTNACTSKFFQGDNPRGWSGDFDWLFENDKNWVKTYEGKYDEHKPSSEEGGYDRLHIPTRKPTDFEGDF